jgi:hypothetical protein
MQKFTPDAIHTIYPNLIIHINATACMICQPLSLTIRLQTFSLHVYNLLGAFDISTKTCQHYPDPNLTDVPKSHTHLASLQ